MYYLPKRANNAGARQLPGWRHTQLAGRDEKRCTHKCFVSAYGQARGWIHVPVWSGHLNRLRIDPLTFQLCRKLFLSLLPSTPYGVTRRLRLARQFGLPGELGGVEEYKGEEVEGRTPKATLAARKAKAAVTGRQKQRGIAITDGHDG